MASESGCAVLLADLAQEYEKSRTLLESLENTLKDRPYLPAPDGPEEPSALELPDLRKERETEDDDHEEEQEAHEEQNQGSSNAAPGLRAKLANFFSRGRLQSSRTLRASASAGIEEPTRRVSVVNLGGPVAAGAAPEDQCRRSVTFHPSSSNAALQPTLQRTAPRVSLEIRQQQLQLFDGHGDAAEPHRLSSSNMAVGMSPMRRRSLDPFAASAGARRASMETSSCSRSRMLLQQLSMEASIAAHGSVGQLQQLQVGSPTGSAPAPINTYSPRTPQQQQQQILADGLTQQVLLAQGREDSHVPMSRRRPMSRRGSDNASGLSRAISFTAAQRMPAPPPPQPPQHQLCSPVGSPTTASCLSPGASVAAGLPALGLSAVSARSLLMCNSSGNLQFSSMRTYSVSSLTGAGGGGAAAAAATAGVAAADDAGSGPLEAFLGERGAVSATGMISIPTITASGASSPCGRTPQVQLPQLPRRARSVHMSPAALLGPGAGGGGEPRRMQSFRFGDLKSGSGALQAPGDDNGGRRQSLGQYGSRCNSSGAGAGGGGGSLEAGYAFRGTMHLI